MWSSLLEKLSFLASHETPCTFFYPKIHYCIQNSLELVNILGQINLVYALKSYLFKFQFSIILPTMHISCGLSIRGYPQILCTHLSSPHTCHMPSLLKMSFI